MAEQYGSSVSPQTPPGMETRGRVRTGTPRTHSTQSSPSSLSVQSSPSPQSPRPLVHGARTPIGSPPTPTAQTPPANLILRAPSFTRVSLANPRPETARTVNEYVETPLKNCESDGRTSNSGSSVKRSDYNAPLHETLNLPISKKSLNNNSKGCVPDVPDSGSGKVVTKQPKGTTGTLATFKKDCGSITTRSGEEDWSIICKECGKCRCEACRQPKTLPSRWLCNNFCYCSLDSCVDYGSCLCCVKGLLYHCATRDGDDDNCADEPCNCGPDRRANRWACLALTSLVLPCLWCYWPLRCMAAACEHCYARYSSRGCRCSSRRQTRTAVFPQKPLLDSSPQL